MPWLAIFHSRLSDVSERIPVNLLKLVVLLFCRPIFQAHNFFFKCVYLFQSRQIFLLREEQRALGFCHVSLNFEDGPIPLNFGLQGEYALRDLNRSLRAHICSLEIHNRPFV